MPTSKIKCPICSKIYPNRSKFTEHVSVHRVEKAYKCNLCSQEFQSRSKLNVHIKCQHEGFRYPQNKRFKCDVCGYEICTENQLINHMRKHTGERPFKCTVNECGMEFKLKLTLKNHIRYKHSNERPLKCNFPGCLYTAKTDVNLIGHMKVHSDDRPFPCPLAGCNFHTKERSQVERHLISVHSEAKTFSCSMCDHKSARADQLKYHMRRHTTRRDFKCSHQQCTESFKSSLDLSRHFSNRHEERNIQCDHPGCGRKYANANALYKHNWACHSEKNLPCPNLSCSYRTNKATKLARHMVAHDGTNEKVSCLIKGCKYKGKNKRTMEEHMYRHRILLPCPVSGCGHYAPSKEALQNHAKLHNPLDRPFQCPLCFKFYATRDQLKSHSAAHTKEKPFRCGHCESGSFSRSNIKKHISVKHANLKFPFVVLPLDDRECLHCNVSLPISEFVIHSMCHKIPVVMIGRLETRLF